MVPRYSIVCGDVFKALELFPRGHFDACLADPPYGLGFMGRAWDRAHNLKPGANEGQRLQAWNRDWADLVHPLLKPGAPLVAASGSRVYHRLASAVEDAGFDVQPMFAWINGQAMAQGLDVSKGIDMLAEADREIAGVKVYAGGHVQRSRAPRGYGDNDPARDRREITAPATATARLFHGYSTRLKDSLGPWVMAYKPPAGGWARNALEHGVAGVNVEAGRVPTDDDNRRTWNGDSSKVYGSSRKSGKGSLAGRFPSNLCIQHLEDCTADECAPGCPVEELRRQSGWLKSGSMRGGERKQSVRVFGKESGAYMSFDSNAGYASRFFPNFRYLAKSGRSERMAGCQGFLWRVDRDHPLGFVRIKLEEWRHLPDRERYQGNIHPTLKPLALCRYLAGLILPPPRADGEPRRLVVLFSGTCSEMIGALMAGWDEVIGIEQDPTYCDIGTARVAAWGPYVPGAANKMPERSSELQPGGTPQMKLF